MEEIIQLLYQASESRKPCRVTLQGEPLSRVVHPYGVCCTTANHIVLVCWQTIGFTKAGRKAGFRNLQLEHIKEVEILGGHFHIQPGFNASDSQYKEWVYHI